MNGIPLYDEINDLHALTGTALRSSNPLFHCFDMATANDLTVTELPPHRVSFYTLALNVGTKELDYTLNDKLHHHPENFIVCVAPGQVVKWKKEGEWKGYCSFFKSEFLNFNSRINFLQQYPFFNLQQTNFFQLEESDFESMSVFYEQIIAEQKRSETYNNEIMASIFQAILWKVRRVFESQNKVTPNGRAGAIITSQFQYLVNEHFLSKISVEQYAAALNVTPNHLSQTVKATTGRTAKSIITGRRVEEAKYLLSYTGNDVAEIGYHLGFSASTHFAKFFKQDTGKTPTQYRTITTSKHL